MKWIWESRVMWKNRWRESLLREKSTAPPACLVVKSGECILKALTLPCTWKQEVDEKGGGSDTVRGALPDDLGFYCWVPGHLIFPPGQPKKPTWAGPGTNGLVMCLGRAEGFAEAPGNHHTTHTHIHRHACRDKKKNAIRHRWRWTEERRMKEEG